MRFLSEDEIAALNPYEYQRCGPARSNLCYGYVRGPVDWAAFA